MKFLHFVVTRATVQPSELIALLLQTNLLAVRDYEIRILPAIVVISRSGSLY